MEILDIKHISTPLDDETITLNINKHNMSCLVYPNKQKYVVLWDSGASRTLITENTIHNNPYLRSITQNICDEELSFTVGSGDKLFANKTITFSAYVQNNMFEITAFIVPCLGGLDLIIGTKALTQQNLISTKRH